MPYQINNFSPCFIEIGDKRCTGCAACSNGCPQSAIEMVLNEDGFYRPLLQNNKCNECLFCHRFCPVLSIGEDSKEKEDDVPEVMAAWSTDENTHLQSSSGGIFSELAHHVFDKKGVVCGCKWNDNWTPTHVMVTNRSELDVLRGSKYIPSRIDNVFYRKIIELTKSGVLVLFCGTPCQVAGLSSIIKPALRKNLILVDLVCHGVPSLTSFWRYLDWKFGDRNALNYFTFRNKEITVQTICAIDKYGRKYLKTCGKNSWFRAAMIYHLFLQESCYSCPFGSIPRMGDVSLGDFWGIPKEWHNPKGDSAIFINTDKGKELIQALIDGDKITVKQSDYSYIAKHVARIRGANYRIPKMRKLSFLLIKTNKYKMFHRFCYLPLKFKKWLEGAIKRRIAWIPNFINRLFS